MVCALAKRCRRNLSQHIPLELDYALSRTDAGEGIGAEPARICAVVRGSPKATKPRIGWIQTLKLNDGEWTAAAMKRTDARERHCAIACSKRGDSERWLLRRSSYVAQTGIGQQRGYAGLRPV